MAIRKEKFKNKLILKFERKRENKMGEKRIIIISETKRKNCDCNGLAQAVKWMLECEKTVAGQERKRTISIEVVDTTEKALEMMRVGSIDVLFFVSGDMTSEAQRIKKQYRRVKIIVSTDLEDEIILIKKSWMGSQFLQTIVFS